LRRCAVESEPEIVDGPDTREYDAPPAARHVYGGLPHLPVLVAGVAASVAAGVLVAGGAVALGLLLLAVAILALVFFAHEAMRHPSSRVDAAVLAGRSRLRSRSAYAAASVRAWSSTSRRVTQLRLRARALVRARNRLQHELGGAVYARDAAAAERLVGRMRALDDELDGIAAEMSRTVERARTDLARERLALQPTESHRPVS
jgi:hypothetical protein